MYLVPSAEQQLCQTSVQLQRRMRPADSSVDVQSDERAGLACE